MLSHSGIISLHRKDASAWKVQPLADDQSGKGLGMTAIVAAVYKQGKIELLETPSGLRDGPVRVVLIEEDVPKPPPHPLIFGKYQSGGPSTLEDFREAEWRGEEEFDGPRG